jgi:hypothetical protein
MRDRNAVSWRKDGKEVYYRVANDNFVKGASLIRQGVVEELERKSAGLRSY